MCTQNKRPMKSIILDPGVIDLVLNDAKDFLASNYPNVKPTIFECVVLQI